MNTKDVALEALSLPVNARTKLALERIESLDNLTPMEIEALWIEEAVRRADQIDAGVVELIDSKTVSAQVRALLQ